MDIRISDHRTIHSIQEEFNKKYPYLKLEFFKKPHRAGSGSSRKLMCDPVLTIGNVRAKHTKGNIHITNSFTVAELEQLFNKNFGLSVQVFRKSGKVWLETTATDGWTLKEQNEEGNRLQEQFKISREVKDYDYD